MEHVLDKIMYHTQKNKGLILKEPILCERADAWLGTAYYFWEDEVDAISWGINSKNNNYRVYKARIKTENFLDAVYNKEHYKFLLDSFNKVSETILKKTGRRPTNSDITSYINEKAGWKNEVDVILMCDIPTSSKEIIPIPFRKRIQAAVYNKECINDFNVVGL